MESTVDVPNDQPHMTWREIALELRRRIALGEVTHAEVMAEVMAEVTRIKEREERE